MFKVASIAAALAVAAGLIMNWSDIQRYLKIERM
ncbi:MAG: DUF6893 family small protein [Bryobacteraceae bacterium]